MCVAYAGSPSQMKLFLKGPENLSSIILLLYHFKLQDWDIR